MSAALEPYAGITIVDDTDHATVERVAPIYAMLGRLGIRTTKTVWALRCENPKSPYAATETLDDKHYAAWVQSLGRDGFEIAWHGAAGDSSLRDKTLRGLERFEKVIGRLPALHINHASNRENLYWHSDRFDSALVQAFVRWGTSGRGRVYDCQDPKNPYYWGDIAQQTIRYCRNLTFVRQINLRHLNPMMPFSDPARPLVPRWFSSCDGGNPGRFAALLSRTHLERLERERGVCIVYTHFGAGFVRDGRVLPEVEQCLRAVAGLRGFKFLPASELLDELAGIASAAPAPTLSHGERRRMEYHWLWEKLTSGGTS